MAELRGGKFGHGFVSAGVVGAFSPSIGKIDGLKVGDISFGQVAGAALLGGTVSEISGGKFANGAATAAFQNLFNDQGVAALKNAQQTQNDNNQSQQQPSNQISRQNEFKQCVNTCIRDNYGSLYEAADALNPLSVSGLVGNEVAEVLDTELQKQGNRNSYGDGKQFRTGQRQLRTLAQFRKFNAASLVVGSGAIGFQLGAQGNCRFQCTNFGE